MSRVVPIGPYHPLQEEPEFFRLHVDGERVRSVDIELGYNHRGIEKLSESKTFDQGLFLVERICGICSNSHPYAYAKALEDAGCIEPPPRAKAIRTIVAELERLHSHLLWLGLAGHFLGYNTVFMWAWKYREIVLDLCELLSGNRNHYAAMKIGGVRWDVSAVQCEAIVKGMDELDPKIRMLHGAVADDPVLHARLKGVGILTREQAIAFNVVGPTARPSGIDIDVRRDHPYGFYDQVEWDVIVRTEGDVYAKVVVRVLEMIESIRIIRQCVGKMPDGSIDADPGDLPAGEGIGQIEAPRGEVFHYVRTDGTNRPVRHKIRAPSYMNVASNEAAIPGGTVSDATIVLAAVDPCYCCTERIAVADAHGRQTVDFEELLRLSREKTARLKAELGIERSPVEEIAP